MFEIRLEVNGVGDLSRFWVSRLSEWLFVDIQRSFKHSVAVGHILVTSWIIRRMRRSAGSLLTRTVFLRSKDVREKAS